MPASGIPRLLTTNPGPNAISCPAVTCHWTMLMMARGRRRDVKEILLAVECVRQDSAPEQYVSGSAGKG